MLQHHCFHMILPILATCAAYAPPSKQFSVSNKLTLYHSPLAFVAQYVADFLWGTCTTKPEEWTLKVTFKPAAKHSAHKSGR